MASVIYLVYESPHSSSVLPSIVNRTGNPQTMVYANLQPPADTARWSPTGWWSLTPPSHPYLTAVIFFCPHLLSPIASTFRSGVPYAARTFLLCLNDTSDRPWQCFRLQKYSFFFKRSTFAIQKVSIINYIQLKIVSTLKFVINLRFEVLIANAR